MGGKEEVSESKGKPHLLYFGVLGLFGGLVNVVINAKSLADFITFYSGRILLLGFLVGVFYWFLHTKKTWPDSVMAIVAGYAGANFIDTIIRRMPL